jgi:hypothetical protein
MRAFMLPFNNDLYSLLGIEIVCAPPLIAFHHLLSVVKFTLTLTVSSSLDDEEEEEALSSVLWNLSTNLL